MFELVDAVLCADGPVRSLVDLTLVAEHRRGHGAVYDALSHGQVQPQRLRRSLVSLSLPRTADGRIVLAVDVSPWLRSDAPTSAQRLFCHVYGRGKGQAQLIPGWPYSFVAALEPGRTSWTALLDAVRLGPTDDATAVTAAQLRAVVDRLIAAGHWRDDDPPVLIVTDAGYDITRLAFLLADLPVQLLGRLRSDRVLRLPKPSRPPGTTGRPPKHGPEFALDNPSTWPSPQHTTTTGARRGELCALHWSHVDLDNAVLIIRSSIAQDGRRTWEKDTKTHQQRRITLDPTTVALLRAYKQHCEQSAAAVCVPIAGEGRVFSRELDHSTWLRPSAVTLRFSRMCNRLGWEMNLHQLRHYSATELIAAGVDVRTVAGRLGHGGGGATTLRVYSAWMSEADQKAAGTFTVRMPVPPLALHGEQPTLGTTTDAHDTTSPYRKMAADVSGAIACGALLPGATLPTVEQLKERYGVSAGTVNREIGELKKAGLVAASRGRRAVVRDPIPKPKC